MKIDYLGDKFNFFFTYDGSDIDYKYDNPDGPMTGPQNSNLKIVEEGSNLQKREKRL